MHPSMPFNHNALLGALPPPQLVRGHRQQLHLQLDSELLVGHLDVAVQLLHHRGPVTPGELPPVPGKDAAHVVARRVGHSMQALL